VEVRADKDKALFSVKSQAVIERRENNWPLLDAAVSVQDGETKVRMWKDG
jgi:hypothetical protein